MGNDSPLRILHVAQPTTEGTAVVVRQLVRAGLDRGYCVSVASPAGGDLGAWAIAEGASWIELPMVREPSLSELRLVRRLRHLMRDADLVVAHSSKAGALARLARTGPGAPGAPLLFLPHGWSWLVGGLYGPMYRVFERWAARRTTATVCVSPEEATEGRRVLGDRVRLEVIENGVDVDALSRETETAERGVDPLLVVVGRLGHQKGQDRAIRALAQMTHPTARLRLIGDGPARADLGTLSGQLGVADRVEFIGRTSATPHVRSADVLLVPSRWEGLSLALLEGMAVGATILATERGSGAALGSAGIGVSGATEGDLVRSLARACDGLLSDPVRRRSLGESATARARDRFSVERTAKQHARLWDEVQSEAAQQRVDLLWLESTASGTAARIHLNGTLTRLRDAGLRPGVVITDSSPQQRTTAKRALRIGRLIVRGVASADSGTLMVRHHPLAAPVLWAWRRRGARIVLSVQGALSDARSDGGRWAKALPVDRLSNWQIRRADALVTVTFGLAEQLRSIARDVPVTTIPNGMQDPGDVEPASPGCRYVCFAGNLATWQGIEPMLAALNSDNWPDGLGLVVIGDGELRDRFVSMTDSRVDFRGQIPHGETLQWLVGAVCTFSLKDPSHPAGAGGYWPFKVLEAAALGVPVVLSDAPGLSEMAEALGHGIVCPYGDADVIAAAVAQLDGDPDLRARLSTAGKRNVGAFRWEAHAELLASVLRPADQ